MLNVCPRCEARNRASAKFCSKCIAPLEPDANGASSDGTLVVTRRLTRVDGAASAANGTQPAQASLAEAESPPVSPVATAPAQAAPAAMPRTTFPPTLLNDCALPGGTLIEGFRIIRSIGQGGFGIVYMAWDASLQRRVAIKEYMPSSLARRTHDMEVTIPAEAARQTFEAGLRGFVNEARLLARFDHPSLVKVFRFWEANKTAYMAMPYYEGPTMKAALAEMKGPPDEALLRGWIDPLLEALSVIHRQNCFHRDISPDNILLTEAGPLLLDFGAARRVINDMTQALTAVLKPGFAPVEQYGGAGLQGPWTDFYALAGAIYYAITGRPPVASVVRVVKDSLQPLARSHAGQYSDRFLRALDAALAVKPEDRPQDVAAFRDLLGPFGGADESPRPEAPAAAAFAASPPAAGPATTADVTGIRASRGGPASAFAEAPRSTRAAALSMKQELGASTSLIGLLDEDASAAPARPRAAKRSRRATWISIASLTTVLAGVLAFTLSRPGEAPSASRATSAVPAASTAATTSPSSPAATAPKDPAAAPGSTDSKAATATATPTPSKPEAPPIPVLAPAVATSPAPAEPPVAKRVEPSPPKPEEPAAAAVARSVAMPAPAVPVTSAPQASRATASPAKPDASPAGSAKTAARPARSRDAGRDAATPAAVEPARTRRASVDAPASASPEPASATPVTTADATPRRVDLSRRPARCAAIILKSSLDVIDAEEVAYLKKECR